MRIKINVNVKIGRIIRYFILSDLIFFAGWGFIDPIFSVFIIKDLYGATLVTVGAFAAIYWILKSILQLPIANYLDRTPGEKDDFLALVFGLLIASISAFLFVIVKNVSEMYLVQALRAAGFALYASSWPAIFSRHLDSDRVSFNWALDSTAVGLAAGVSGFIGGIIADAFGFETVFVFTALLSASSAILLLLVPDLVLPKGKKTQELLLQRGGRPPEPLGK